MSYGKRLLCEAVKTIGFGSITPTYTTIGSSLEFPARILIIQNTTNVELMFSFDGMVDHIPLPATKSIIIDGTTNKVDDAGFFVSVGSNLSVRSIALLPNVGNVYVSAIYGKGD